MTLPHGWVEAKFAEITPSDAPIIYGILQPGPNISDGIPYVRPTEIVENVIDLRGIRRTSSKIAQRYARSALRVDDTILSIVGTIGKVARVPIELDGGNITQSSCRIRADAELLVSDYLRAYLRSPFATNQYDEKRLGTAVPRLNIADIRNFKIPLPPPTEQRRIVKKLDALAALIARARAELDRVRLLAPRLRQTALDKAFVNNSTGEPVRLGNLGKWSSGGTPKSSESSYYAGDIPWLRSGDLQDGPIDRHVVTITQEGLQASSAKWVPAGAVLIAMYGATIGKLGITTYPVTTNQAVACIVPDDNVDRLWLFYLLLQMRPRLIALGQGGAQPNISQQILKAIEASRPPLKRQLAVATAISASFTRADRLEAEAGRARAMLDRLESALLGRAFRGELVPQDPNDEPAQALLDRIRGQRAAAPKPKRGRRKKV